MKKTIVILLTIAMIFLFIGCNKDKDQIAENPIPSDTLLVDNLDEISMRDSLVCYQDDFGYLVPVMIQVPWEEGIAKAVLRNMKNNDANQEKLMSMGLNALLPASTEIIGLSINDGVAKINFNDGIFECNDALSESNMVQGIVLTLAAFPTINSVEFMANGEHIDNLTYGTDVSKVMEPGDLNIELGEGVFDPDGSVVTIYFNNVSASSYNYYVPVSRVVDSAIPTLEVSIKELLNGPKDGSVFTSVFPEGTELLGVQMTNGITYINFNERFNDLHNDPDKEVIALNSLYLSAMEFGDVTEVSILVNGEEYVVNQTMPTFANVYDTPAGP